VLAQVMLTIEERRPAWHRQALCRGEWDRWFPSEGGQFMQQELARICAKCPVRKPCADAGKTENAGMWGGISAGRRRR
jgi:hypothetical protein